MDDEQIRRVAANEARFRAMNERQAGAVATFHGDEQAPAFHAMCECVISECEATIELTPDAWRQIRSNPRWFAVRPDHVMPQVESRVEDHGEYWIIEKHPGPGAEVAESTA